MEALSGKFTPSTKARTAERQAPGTQRKSSIVGPHENQQVIAAVDTGDADNARAALDSAVPVIDRMANRGIIKKNKAARHKSRLNARVKALAS